MHYLNPDNLNLDYWWREAHDYKEENWFILTYITGTDGVGLHSKYSVDDVFRNSEKFISEATLTYMIVEVKVTPSHGGSYTIDGQLAIDALMRRKFKIQVLASTYYLEGFGPNTILKNSNIDDFFSAAEKVSRAEGDGSFYAYLFATQVGTIVLYLLHQLKIHLELFIILGIGFCYTITRELS